MKTTRAALWWRAVNSLRQAEALAGLGSRVHGVGSVTMRPVVRMGKPITFNAVPKTRAATRDESEPDPADRPPADPQEEHSWIEAWKKRASAALEEAGSWAASGDDTLKERAADVGRAVKAGADAIKKTAGAAASGVSDFFGLGAVEKGAEALLHTWETTNLIFWAAVAWAISQHKGPLF